MTLDVTENEHCTEGRGRVLVLYPFGLAGGS
jgi:hypothetical protein